MGIYLKLCLYFYFEDKKISVGNEVLNKIRRCRTFNNNGELRKISNDEGGTVEVSTQVYSDDDEEEVLTYIPYIF